MGIGIFCILALVAIGYFLLKGKKAPTVEEETKDLLVKAEQDTKTVVTDVVTDVKTAEAAVATEVTKIV